MTSKIQKLYSPQRETEDGSPEHYQQEQKTASQQVAAQSEERVQIDNFEIESADSEREKESESKRNQVFTDLMTTSLLLLCSLTITSSAQWRGLRKESENKCYSYNHEDTKAKDDVVLVSDRFEAILLIYIVLGYLQSIRFGLRIYKLLKIIYDKHGDQQALIRQHLTRKITFWYLLYSLLDLMTALAFVGLHYVRFSYEGKFCSGDLEYIYGSPDKILKNKYQDHMTIKRGETLFMMIIQQWIMGLGVGGIYFLSYLQKRKEQALKIKNNQ